MLNLYKIPKLYFYRLVLLLAQPIYIRIFKLRAVGLENVPKEGPYILIGNHSHKLDPFFIGALIRRPLFQMASNEYFRIPIMRRFMWAMGAFPFEKYAKVDHTAIKYAIKLVREEGHPIGIYPEGGRNWDGKTLPVIEGTGGMIRMLNIPVVPVVSRGNYIAWPRWANKRRKSPIIIQYGKPVTFGKSSTREEVVAWMQQALEHNDNDTIVEKIRGKNPAEGLTRLLWRCPVCGVVEGLVEKKGTFLTCNACGIEWEVNLQCWMRELGTDTWKPIKEYANLMVREEEIVPIESDTAAFFGDNEKVYLQSWDITLYHQPKYPKLKKVAEGRLYLSERGLAFTENSNDMIHRYPFQDIQGRSTEKNFIFQLGTRDKNTGGIKIARFEMPNESCLKWEIIYTCVRNRYIKNIASSSD
jgi:1-acyl-sn-glycerol-3-phosphate acyltransferase